MAETDSLNISISASATKASQSIKTLTDKFNALATSLNAIRGQRLEGLATGVEQLGNATKSLRGIKASEFNKAANAFKKFGEIDSEKLSAVSSSLTGLASGVNALASVPELKNVTSIVNALKNLSTANVSGFDIGKFDQIATSVSSFATQLSTIGEIDSKVVRLVGAIARLSNSGQYIGNVATNFPTLSKSVETFARNMTRISGVDANITKLVDGIARLASAGNKTADTAKHLDDLGAAVLRLLNNLKSAPQLNANLANTIQGLGNLAQSGGRVSVATGTASGGTTKFGNALKGLKDKLSSATKSSKGLVSQIGMFYAKMLLVIRAVKSLGKSVESSMDYIETLNYFNAGFGQVAENANLNDYKKYGYKSAEAYYDSFSKRAEQLTQKMSGYKVLESGMAVSTDEKSLGIDPNLVMNYQTQFAQMSSSMGVASETAVQLSSTLTRLGADLASVKNLDFADVWEDMSSGLVGMSRTLDKYGTNIRNVNLQQKATELGISTSVASMNQQNKALLRTIILLDSTRYAWGDMSKTIQQPANQLRLLQSNWSNLSRTIGNIFLPIVAKVLPYLNALVIMLQKAAQAIAKFLGFDKDFDWGGLGGTGGGNIDLGDLADDSGDLADNMDKTAKKAKKAADNLQGFDIINKLQDTSDDDDGKSKKPDTSAADLAKMEDALAKLTDEYDNHWKDALEEMQNKAQELANKMKKAIVDAWKKSDFSKLGKALAEWINKGLKKINWKKIQENVKKAAKSLATFFNGLIKGLDWKLIGKTLAEGLNTILTWSYNFWTTFDWLTFGTSIADGLNSAVKNFDAKLLGKTLAAKLRGIIQFAFGLVTTFNFSQLGKKIGDSINAFFTDMGKVDKRTGLTGWQEMGKTISDGIKGIATTITTALSTVNWDSVGQAVAGFLTSIEWWDILGKFLEVLKTTFSGIMKMAIAAFADNPAGMIKALSGALALAFTVTKVMKALMFLKNTFKNSISSILNFGLKSTTVSSDSVSTLGTNIGTALGKLGGKLINFGKSLAGNFLVGFEAGGIKEGLNAALKGITLSSGAILGLQTLGVAAAGAILVGLSVKLEKELEELLLDNPRQISENYKKSANILAQVGLKDVKDKVDKVNKALEDSTSATKNFSDALKTTTTTETGKNIDDLADKYYNLSKKKNRSATEDAVLKQYSEELLKVMPDLKDNIDSQTGAYKGTKEELNGLVGSTNRAAKAQAAYNKVVALYEEQQNIGKTIKEAQKAYDEAENIYSQRYKEMQDYKKSIGLEKWNEEMRDTSSNAYKLNSATLVANSAMIQSKNTLDKAKKSQKDINKEIKQANNVMNNAQVSTKKYSKANDNLKASLKKIGIKGKGAKSVIKKLNKAVDDGEISWEDYKNITDKNYKSTDELQQAIDKVKPKDVTIDVTTKGKKNVDDIKTSTDALGNKTVTVGADVTGKNSVDEFGKRLDEFGKKTVNATIGVTTDNKTDNKLKTIVDKMNKLNGKLKVTTDVDSSSYKKTENKMKKLFKEFSKLQIEVGTKSTSNIKNLSNFGSGVDTSRIKAKRDKNGNVKSIKIPKDKAYDIIAEGWIKDLGKKNVTRYATGGFPDRGQLFLANEAGAEMVGKMNGRTTVANQQEIAQGFATAITNTLAPVMYEAFRQAARETMSETGGDVYLDGRKITESVIKHTNQISRQNGKSPIWGVS